MINPGKFLTAATLASALMLGGCEENGWDFDFGIGVEITASAEDVADPPATFTLDNGMEVVVIKDDRAPVVTHMVWYRVGSADEPAGKSGIAHFLEHLMFKGTAEIPPGEFSKIVARNGGQDNAFTSYDYTAYFQRVAKDRLPLVMRMEADRMRNLQLTENVVLPERDVILEERSMRLDNDPAALLGEQVSAALFRDHPYGIPIIGWEHEIAQLGLDDALSFYDRHYGPDNAILVVAGDVSVSEVRALARQYYGPIEARSIPERDRPAVTPLTEAGHVEFADPRVGQPYVQRTYLVPSFNTGRPGEPEALSVLARVLLSGTTSRFYRELVVDRGFAAAGGWYSGLHLNKGRLSVYAVPADGMTLEQAEAAIDAAIDRFLESALDEAEVERAKYALRAELIYARDSQQALAQTYGAALATGLTVEEVATQPQRLAAVTADQVMQAARDYLASGMAITGYLRPAAKPGKPS